MTLQCPHCGAAATHKRRDVLGHFVICPECDRHYPWEQAKVCEPEAGQKRRPADREWDGVEPLN
jgi:hypothetical protein